MTYPPAPWQLKGYAVQSLHLVDVEKARSFVPEELEIVSFLPGKTLGVVYLSSYETGSVLEYNELIVTAAFVRYKDKVGGWISHIYVDNEDSVAGGREIWSLPKELADFTWENNSVTVTQGERLLCCLNYKKAWFSFTSWWKNTLTLRCISGLGSDFLFFKSDFEGKLGLLKGSLKVPVDSPFADLNLGRPKLTMKLNELNLIAGVPEIIGEKKSSLSYR
ncbi:MAG: acetoacetate decarboxylase family protein [Prochloraceae cyanobacterium]|nr:acetoacetate decarboxylase family protein [Prochloraceae cyanobacterium]